MNRKKYECSGDENDCFLEDGCFLARFVSPSKRTPFLLLFACFTTNIERDSKHFIADERKINDGILLRLSIDETNRKEKVSDGWFFVLTCIMFFTEECTSVTQLYLRFRISFSWPERIWQKLLWINFGCHIHFCDGLIITRARGTKKFRHYWSPFCHQFGFFCCMWTT